MTFHTEILTDRQRQVLAAIAPIARADGYYLAGGTAIALHFGHRRSEDFDWFAPELKRPEMFAADLRRAGIVLDAVDLSAGTVNSRIDGVKVQFLEFAYPLLAPADEWAEQGVTVASVRDLAAMKLLAIAQRGSRKDFVDVYELMQHGANLKAMLDDFRQKFQADAAPALRGLVYFDDAEAEPMPEMLSERPWSTMRAALQQAVREAAR